MLFTMRDLTGAKKIIERLKTHKVLRRYIGEFEEIQHNLEYRRKLVIMAMRDADICTRVKNGATKSAVARVFHITPARVGHIVDRERRKEERRRLFERGNNNDL